MSKIIFKNEHFTVSMNTRRLEGLELEKEALEREISIEERIKRQGQLLEERALKRKGNLQDRFNQVLEENRI
jgi:hypothetical protein